MSNIIEAINNRLTLLKRAIKIAEKEQARFPDGRLRVNKTARQTRFYNVKEKGDSTGEYLSKSEMNIIKQLAQKDYNRQFSKAAEAEIRMLEKMLLKYTQMQTEESYNSLSYERKQLVTPYILPDDLLAKEWQSRAFKSNPYKPENKIYDTRKGEKVRSKSEAIIADMLYELGIPYRYEFPAKMHDGTVKYPDFTLLKTKTRDIIYLEHFGRMDDEGYRKDTMEKMDIYRASGIYPGKNLIFTYETEYNPLDINGIRNMFIELFQK